MLRHKFKAKPTEYNGIKFASKKEQKRYCELQVLKSAGDILFFLRQVPVHLSGGVKYVCDFLIFWSDGTVTFEDVKGFRTDLYKTKKKMIEATYPFKIIES
jgi:hypothetical protein